MDEALIKTPNTIYTVTRAAKISSGIFDSEFRNEPPFLESPPADSPACASLAAPS